MLQGRKHGIPVWRRQLTANKVGDNIGLCRASCASRVVSTLRKTPAIIFGLALFACALPWVPDKYKPKWFQQLKSWQALIGLVAVIMAILVVMNPELYALGILGDSAFFDLLVLAISLQLQASVSRVWYFVTARLARTVRRMSMQICFELCCLVALVATSVSAVQKTVHRMFS